VKRWNIDAPCNNQYEEHPEGEWVTFEDHEKAVAAAVADVRERYQAEDDVLDAMAAIPAESFGWLDGVSVTMDAAIAAELRRREALK
jgi:hypothetical protein